MNAQALKETVKELLRVVVLAAVTAGLGWLAQKVNVLDPTSIFYVVGTLVLKLADGYIHKNKDIAANGLLPF